MLTTELVRAGNQQAISFRPAFEAAIEAALDTDTVRSIFRNAIRTVHADVLRGGSGSSGINLSDSISVITSTLQLPSDARGSPIQEGGFATTFADTTERLASLGVWSLESTVEIVGFACLAGAVLAAAAAIALATTEDGRSGGSAGCSSPSVCSRLPCCGSSSGTSARGSPIPSCPPRCPAASAT